MGKILVKQATGVQQFQEIGQGENPSMRQLFGRFKDPTAGRMDKVRAGLGVAGKVGALAATGLSAAQNLQSGNVGGALSSYNTYRGLDPTVGTMQSDVTPAEKQRTMVGKNKIKLNNDDLTAMTNAGIDVTNTAAATPEQLNQYNPITFPSQPAQAPGPTGPPTTSTPGGALPPIAAPQTTPTSIPLPNQSIPLPTAAPAAAAPAAAAPAAAVPTPGTLGALPTNATGAAPVTPPVTPPAAGIMQPPQMGALVPPMPGQAPPAPVAPVPAPVPAAPIPAPAPAAPAPVAPAPAAPVAVTDRKNRQGQPLSPALSAKEDARQAEMKAAGKTRPVSNTEKDAEIDAMYAGLGDAPAAAPAAPQAAPVAPQAAPAAPTDANKLKDVRDFANRLPPSDRTVGVTPTPQAPAHAGPPPVPPAPQEKPFGDTLGWDKGLTQPPNKILGDGSNELKPVQSREPIPYQKVVNTQVPWEGREESSTTQQHGLAADRPKMTTSDLYGGTPVHEPTWRDELSDRQYEEKPTEQKVDYSSSLDNFIPRGQRLPVGVGGTIGSSTGYQRKPLSSGSDEEIADRQKRKTAQDYFAPENWQNNVMRNGQFQRSFVDMVFNEFGDLFHKANPHEVGSIVMGLYLDRMVK